MADGISLNLQLLQNISDMTGTSAGGNNVNKEPIVYAKEGDPNYDETMDADADGVVTMEEYQDYCKENGISTDEQAASLQSLGNSMIQKQAAENNINYDDYIKYCEENNAGAKEISGRVSTQINESGLTIRNSGKALTSYSGNQIRLPEAKVERNA